MVIIEEDGLDFMVTGATENDMKEFDRWLDKTRYKGCTGYNHFKIPKNGKTVDVYIVSCDTRYGRGEIVEYFTKKGHKYEEENMQKLRCCW